MEDQASGLMEDPSLKTFSPKESCTMGACSFFFPISNLMCSQSSKAEKASNNTSSLKSAPKEARFYSMFRWFRLSSTPSLSDAQLRMYASETSENFRWVSKLVATHSSRILTCSDLATIELQQELSEIGQFAEVAHGHLSPFIWRNMTKLCQPDFPLHGYDALQGSNLVSAFCGKVAEVEGYVAVRVEPKQLVIVFSGTAATAQALYNLDIRLIKYPAGDKCAVHAGFWKMYSGARSLVLEAMSRALSEYAVEEIVFTGHSLGAVMCYLLALDVMMNQENHPSSSFLPTSLRLKLAVFGSPRIGNRALSLHWRNIVAAYRTRHGEASVSEYSVKTFNDGVPALPLQSLGYRHFSRAPLYFTEGRLYHVPESESEPSIFKVDGSKDDTRPRLMDHPKGGHLYYNGRDMERTIRRLGWSDVKLGEAGWEERYRKRLSQDYNETH